MKIFLLILITLLLLLFVSYWILIGPAEKPNPEIITLQEPVYIVGLGIATNDRDIYKDVEAIAAKFKVLKGENSIMHLKQPWASINISRDYNPEEKTFTYIVGDVVTAIDAVPPGLKYYEIPAISYAVFPIRPRSRFAWGITMGRMKRFIYTEWLPKSGYRPSGLIGDFELHDERSLGKKPEIRLYVAIEELTSFV